MSHLQPDVELGQVYYHNDRSKEPLVAPIATLANVHDNTANTSGYATTYRGNTRNRLASHKDAFGREPNDKEYNAFENETKEVFLDPSDGRLRTLKVQARSKVREASSWDTGKLKSGRRPLLLAVIDWTYGKSSLAFLTYVPAVFAITFFLLLLCRMELELENQGFYDPVLYRNWKFPGIARNLRENRNAGLRDEKDDLKDPKASRPSQDVVGGEEQAEDYGQSFIERRPMPKFLVYVEDVDLDRIGPNDEVAREIGRGVFEDYVFVSYTRAQFHTGDPDLSLPPSHPDRQAAHRDRVALLKIGVEAARRAGVRTFWLDCFPLVDTQADKEDVYRICDVVRTAHSLCIALDSSQYISDPTVTIISDKQSKAAQTWHLAMQDWGKRLWTLPEVLLCKSAVKIAVYDRHDTQVREYNKRNLGYLGWSENDWQDTSQLLDHYESTVHLTQLELVSIAHRCLRRRKTSQRYPGDVAYALMGLLRRRPAVVHSDSDFMAFARLSLSNSSDAILERLICMQPPSKDTEWHRMVDAWGAKLYDIQPSCKIAAIDTDKTSQTVVLDGVHGASICWSALTPVAFLKRTTLLRRLTRILLPKAPWILLIAAILLGSFAYALQQQHQALQSINSLNGPRPVTVSQTVALTSTYPTTNGFFRSTATQTYTSVSVRTTTVTPAPAATGASSNLDSVSSTTQGIYGFYIAVASVLVALGAGILAAAPALLLNLYRGKFWSTQARFFGIQGYVDLRTLEHGLFGLDDGRLRWSTATSMQSRPALSSPYAAGTDAEYDGADPSALALPERNEEGMQLFTLVDTYVLEATVFYAARPPSVVMVCGEEGGMQRAVLCSYDWRSQTFCREVVLRMKTIVLNRMARVDKFRFALSRTDA